MRNALTILLLLSTFSTFSQTSVRALNNYMEEARKGSYKTAPESIFEDSRNEAALLQAAAVYLTDSVDRIRSKAYSIIKQIGQKSQQASVRIQAVSHLVAGLNDPDGGIIGTNLSGLTGFRKEDFGPDVKQQLVNRISPAVPHVDQLCKLVGYLEIPAATPRLNDLIASATVYKNKWAAYLALARMGDEASVNYLNRKLQTAPINDNFVYDIVPDLVYTRQPEIFEFLEKVIQSEQPDCQSADPDSEARILCGYRVLEYIAYAIVDFPIATDAYGEPVIDDYEEALQDVRTWIDAHPTYAMNTSVY